MTAVLPTSDTSTDWRVTAGDDSPAGPLFSHEHTESELALQDPMALNCSLATGSATIFCCA